MAVGCAACAKLKNLAVTFGDVVVTGVTTGQFVSQQIGDIRMKTCQGCPSFDPQGARCQDCGCYLKVKTVLKAAKCPKGKWTV